MPHVPAGGRFEGVSASAVLAHMAKKLATCREGVIVVSSNPSQKNISIVALMAVIFFLLFIYIPVGYAATGSRGAARVESFSPQGLVTAPQVIRAVFSTKMAKSADIGRDVDSDEIPFEITPHLVGSGRWANASTFIYKPSSGYMQEATEYSVLLRDDLTDADGKTITGTREFKMHTSPLAFNGAVQTNFDIDSDFVDYRVSFNMPVSSSILEGYMSIVDKKGRKLQYRLMYNNVSRSSHEVRVPAGDGSEVRLNIESGLLPESGTLGLKKALSLPLSRDMSLKIGSSSAYNGYIYIGVSSAVDVGRAASFVEVSPPHKISIESYSGGMWIYGDFKSRERVTVRLRKGLLPLKGPALAEDWERAFIFPDAEPTVYFGADGRFISPVNESLLMPVTTVNVDKLNVSVLKVYDNNVPFIMRNGWAYYVSDLAEKVFEKTYEIESAPNETAEHSIDLSKILAGRKGLFQINASVRESYWADAYRVINVTDMAGSMKLWKTGALVWVNSITGGTPVTGAQVSIYSSSNQILAEGYTDKGGIFTVELNAPWNETLLPAMAIITLGDDVSVLRVEESIWSRGESQYSGLPYSYGEYTGYCFTPRGVFRPGESVPIQMIIRERDLSLAEPFPVELKVFTSTGREWKSTVLKLSQLGFADTLIETSEAAPTGAWRAEVFIPGEKTPIATVGFVIEDFAPPKISLSTRIDKSELFAGENAKLYISSQYLFGAPADNLYFEVETSLIPREYAHPDWADYRFSDCRVEFKQIDTQEGDGHLSSEGEAEFELNALDYNVPSILDYVVRAGVMEDGGRWVYKSLSLPFYPNRTLLGIKPPQGTISTNSGTRFEFAAIDAFGTPAVNAAAILSVYRVRPTRIDSVIENRSYSDIKIESVPLEGFDGIEITFGDGRVQEDIKFDSAGSYIVALEEPETGATSAIRIYVNDPRWNYGASESVLSETLAITLDKESYRVGEKVKIAIYGSFAGDLLMSVETDKVLKNDAKIVSADGGEFEIEVTEDMAPNAWITAHLVRGAAPEENWGAHRAFGAVPINIDCVDKKLSIEIKSPEKISPWKKNLFSIDLCDSAGNGIEGEVALMLVDDGVLSLTRYTTPDFYDFYIKRRGLDVDAYDVYKYLMPLYLKNPPALTPGGGADYMDTDMMAKASLSPVRGKRFNILTLYKRITTDQTGHADFSFVLPEFTGRARLMAVAATRGAFGSYEQLFPVARDVVAELSLPRVLAPDDVFESQMLIFNRTGVSLDMNLTLDIDGPIYIIEGNENKYPSGTRSLDLKLALSPSDSAFAIPILLKAGDESGLSKLTLKSWYPGGAAEETTELPVRPPYPRISRTGSASIDRGASIDLKLDSDWFPGTGRAVLSMSGMPETEIADVAMFLMDYPYYCLEQTVSSAWALMSQPELIKRIDPNLATSAHIAKGLSDRMMRIQSMQLYNGSFSMWSGLNTDNWNTAYATHLLIAAEMGGVKIPTETLKLSLSYLEQLLSVTPQNESPYVYGSELALRSYISYIIALRGSAPLSWMSYLRDDISNMPEYGRIFLAGAYARSGHAEIARDMLGDNSPAMYSRNTSESEKLNFDSDLRNKALRLLAWNEISPSDPNTVRSALDLLKALRVSQYYTTQEAAWAFMSLARFFEFNKGEGSPLLEASQYDSKIIKVVSGDEAATLKLDDGIKGVIIKNTGEGRGYVSWTSDGVPMNKPEAEDKGLVARVEYYDSTGIRILNNATITRGQRVTGIVRLLSLAGEAQNIVAVLPLAGGFEIENPRLMDPEESEYPGERNSNLQTELRDDRLVIVVDYFEKTFSLKFTMRAVTSGKFTLPPIAAEGMYSPGVRSVGETSVIIIE
jgi:uncharacterized protein YfaS (alpha-2-macroglobulin family)